MSDIARRLAAIVSDDVAAEGLLRVATPALADVAGIASVVDGDTIEVHGQRASSFTGSTRRRAASYAAWTANRGNAERMRRTHLPGRSPVGP